MKTYSELRGVQGSQEANYNMGRLLHQLGLFPKAIYYYNSVLESKVPDLVKNNSELLNLKKEAAFNLHLIYMNCENTELSRLCLENYIVI